MKAYTQAQKLYGANADVERYDPSGSDALAVVKMANRGDDLNIPMSPFQQFVPSVASRDYVVDVRTLIVGSEASFSGEIGSCDRLIVEGKVQANAAGCKNLMIAETGEFGGCVSAENVDLRGRFEGDLVACKRLVIHSTGQVSGRITYQEIEIERGGQISGAIHVLRNDGGIPDRDKQRHRRTPNSGTVT
jgi:cytoskeletal protein CcmA (bactofilin family)